MEHIARNLCAAASELYLATDIRLNSLPLQLPLSHLYCINQVFVLDCCPGSCSDSTTKPAHIEFNGGFKWEIRTASSCGWQH